MRNENKTGGKLCFIDGNDDTPASFPRRKEIALDK